VSSYILTVVSELDGGSLEGITAMSRLLVLLLVLPSKTVK